MDYRRYYSKSNEVNDPQIFQISDPLDSDVKEEKMQVGQLQGSGNPEDHIIVLKDLRKQFEEHKGFLWRRELVKVTPAVKDMCLRIKTGECFGLLGPNGAGKSTTLAMITGDLAPTSGKIYINGYDISEDLTNSYQISGYCPQNDPFPLDLVGDCGGEFLFIFKRKRLGRFLLKMNRNSPIIYYLFIII